MELLGRRLRERARQLQLSDAEVARRSGLAERRYGHYVRGTREPDLATVLRISDVLDWTPNDLLLTEVDANLPDPRAPLLARLAATARKLSIEDLSLAIRQVEAILARR